MADTLIIDISYHNPVDLDNLPAKYRVILIRANDGNFRDPKFAEWLKWCKDAVARNRLDCFGVYFVWENTSWASWEQTAETFIEMVGKPHPRMYIVLDLESWAGRYTFDVSESVNACRRRVRIWLREHSTRWQKLRGIPSRRIGGYGNAGDLNTLWKHRPRRMWIVLANYTSNAPFKNKLAHQFTDAYHIPGFGTVDMSSADGYSMRRFMRRVGVAHTKRVPVKSKTHHNGNYPKGK